MSFLTRLKEAIFPPEPKFITITLPFTDILNVDLIHHTIITVSTEKGPLVLPSMPPGKWKIKLSDEIPGIVQFSYSRMR